MAPKYRDVPTAHSCSTGKVRYSTKRIADANIPRIQEWYVAHGVGQMPIDSYICKRCKGWHLTSKEYD